jgi:hypothetical protein
MLCRLGPQESGEWQFLIVLIRQLTFNDAPVLQGG